MTYGTTPKPKKNEPVPVNLEALREKLDPLYTGEPALPARLSAGSLNATYVPKWKPNTAYLAGDKVLSPNGDVVSAIANFTSGTTFNAANWNLSASYTTPAQAAGLGAALSIVFGG